MSELWITRPATAADAARCVEIEALGTEQFRDSAHPEVLATPGESAEAFAVRAAKGELLVAAGAAGVVGFALVSASEDAAHVDEIDVDPAWQGRGVGGALLDAAAAWGKARGATRLTLTTFRNIPWNEPFYRRRGFAELAAEDATGHVRAEAARNAARGWGTDVRIAMVRPIT